MKLIKTLSIVFLLTLIKCAAFAQVYDYLLEADKQALEGIIVENYYTNNIQDKLDTAGGALPAGAVTYRIYVDMKPGYTLQAVFGITNHPLTISTTTKFYNNLLFGSGTGDKIDNKKINNSTLAFDSWLTISAANKTQNGILLTEDTDGSLLNLSCFNKVDGLQTGKVMPLTFFGIDPGFFNDAKSGNTFTTDNGSWAIFGGLKGATESNKVLIAQLTTDGKLSFELNVQIGTPKGASVQYVAKNPVEKEIKFDGLKYERK